MEPSDEQLEAVDAIQEMVVLHKRMAATIETMRKVHLQFGRSGVPGSLFIKGEPGAGKTTLIDAYKDRYADGPGTILDVLVPVPGDPSSLLEVLLAALRDPLPTRGSISQRTGRLLLRLTRENVGLLILDEIGNFMDSRSHQRLLLSAAWLKNLMMRSKVPIIALGAEDETYDSRGQVLRINSAAVIHVDRQLSDRFRYREEIRPFSWKENAGEFLTFLKALDRGLPLPSRSGLDDEQFALRLFYACDGRMRPLMNLIREAAGQAVSYQEPSISRERFSVAFEDVCQTDAVLRAKENPFTFKVFEAADYNAALARQDDRLADMASNNVPEAAPRRNRGRKRRTND